MAARVAVDRRALAEGKVVTVTEAVQAVGERAVADEVQAAAVKAKAVEAAEALVVAVGAEVAARTTRPACLGR